MNEKNLADAGYWDTPITKRLRDLKYASADEGADEIERLREEVERLKPIAHEAWLVALACQFAPQIDSQRLYDLCVDYGMSPLASDIPPETTGGR